MKIQKLDIVRFASKGKDGFYDAIVSKPKKEFSSTQLEEFKTILTTIANVLFIFYKKADILQFDTSRSHFKEQHRI